MLSGSAHVVWLSGTAHVGWFRALRVTSQVKQPHIYMRTPVLSVWYEIRT